MSEIEYTGLVLEDELLDHLAKPESAMVIWKEQLDPELLAEGDVGIRQALVFVQEYIEEHRMAPDISVIAAEVGYEDFQEPRTPVEYVIAKLRERYQRQSLKRTITKIARLAEDPKEALVYGFNEFSRILVETESRQHSLSSQNTQLVLDRYETQLEKGPTGITFGYPEIDQALNGIRGLAFVVARPKRYKSWQLLKSAVEALQQQQNVDFFTLEMSPEEIQDRLHCMVAGVSWFNFTHNQISSGEKKLMQSAADWLKGYSHELRIIQPPIGKRTVPYMRQLAVEHGAAAMYIDQLSWIEPVRKVTGDQNWLEVKYVCHDLKSAAAEIPIFCAAQFSRQAAGLREMADLEAIGLSDSVGQVADLVLGIHGSREMLKQHIIHYGAIAGRQMEISIWETKVELTEWSNFRVSGLVTDDDD